MLNLRHRRRLSGSVKVPHAERNSALAFRIVPRQNKADDSASGMDFMQRLTKIDPAEAKRLQDRAEECLALSDIASDPQARQAYERMAEAYLILAGKTGSEKPRLLASSIKKSHRRLKHTTSLKDRLNSFAMELREKASHLPSSEEREALLKRARLAETASHLNDWANSSGLRPPK